MCWLLLPFTPIPYQFKTIKQHSNCLFIVFVVSLYQDCRCSFYIQLGVYINTTGLDNVDILQRR